MKSSLSIQLKAALLLIVFAMNTVVGFACSIGLNMGFNSKENDLKETLGTVVHVHENGEKHIHHEKEKSNSDEKVDQHVEMEATELVVHIHKNGKKHIHEKKKDSHNPDKAHRHNEASKHQEQEERPNHDQSKKHDETNRSENSKSEEGNCCTDEVKQFQQLDKSIPTPSNLVHPVFFTTFVSVYYNISLSPHTDIVRDIKPFVRSYHPPIQDIRIAIQSFQI